MSTVLRDEERTGPVGAVTSSIDRFSRFLGLSVGQFYIICAFVTLWEVVARYVFDAPTSWAFEVVMVLCATAWMLSVGYVTAHRRHIGITVFYLMATDNTRWWLDLLGMVVGVFALYLLASDTMIRALESIDIVERYGSAFNSPQPMLLKTALLLGAVVYLAQLLTNLHRHVPSKFFQNLVLIIGGLLFLRLLILLAAHYAGDDGAMTSLSGSLSGLGETLDPRQLINLRDYDIGTVSIGIVIALIALMATGMPLGVVTLLISIVCALLFFGPKGLYLVSTNAFGLLES
ncbi:MAG: TRAP transporter small permease subunit, partial [Geminicoccaceae bacterium]